MGGAVPGSRSATLTEIYQEGLRVRQLRFYSAGVADPGIVRLIADNTRMPEAVLGDLRAQVAACRTGELGTVLYQCESCGQTHAMGRSCGNRQL